MIFNPASSRSFFNRTDELVLQPPAHCPYFLVWDIDNLSPHSRVVMLLQPVIINMCFIQAGCLGRYPCGNMDAVGHRADGHILLFFIAPQGMHRLSTGTAMQLADAIAVVRHSKT